MPNVPKNGDIALNMACCLGCRQVLVSKTVHDYRKCSCENGTVVDGGTEYLKRAGADLALVEELSIVYHDGVFRKYTDMRDVAAVIES